MRELFRNRLFLPSVLLPAAVLVVLGPAAAQPPKVEKVALLVGITKYKHGKLDDLKYTEADVEELATLLRTSGYGRVVLLTNARGAGDDRLLPTLGNIRREFQALLKGLGKHDLVLVALSGHGVQLTAEGKDSSFFCPQDANPTDPQTLLSLARAYQELDDSGAGTKLLLVDACRHDPGAKGGKGIDSASLPATPAGLAALFSCKPGQRSFEHKDWGHGAFFYTVLEGLRVGANGKLAADLDGDGTVDFDELSRYVRKRVPGLVKKVQGFEESEQFPNDVRNLTDLVPLVRLAAGTAKPGELPKTKADTRVELERELNLDLPDGVKLKLVRIPAAGKSFWMGSPPSEEDHREAEEQHQVEFTQDYWLAVTETTQAQFRAVRGENPSTFRGDDCPVDGVSWDIAQVFCDELNEKFRRAGLRFHLPTEAEWEYAARGGATEKTSLPFHFQDGPAGKATSHQANFDGSQPFPFLYSHKDGPYLRRTTRVASYRPNRFGLHDMHGNVAEWCQDWYGPYSGLKTSKDPVQNRRQGGDVRVLRGGYWQLAGRDCRAAVRDRQAPETGGNFNGFRVACDVSPDAPALKRGKTD